MEEDTHNGGLCVSFSLQALSCQSSVVLFMCALFSYNERSSSGVCLLSRWPGLTELSIAGLRSQLSAARIQSSAFVQVFPSVLLLSKLEIFQIHLNYFSEDCSTVR